MRLHKDKKLFSDAINITAQEMKLPPIYIEKDYWVTYALYSIFNSDLRRDVIFKGGGTALSKCFDLMIQRFSEDIDLAVLRHEGETDNKLKRKLKGIGKSIEIILPETPITGITR